MPKLHINTVAINGWEYTKGMIDSIRTKQDFLLRVIDQESWDGTKERCEENGIACKRYQPRVSLSEAWNYAIQEALKDTECEYIFMPNNDVIFHKETIDNLLEAMEFTGYAMVTGNNVAPVVQDRIPEFKKMAVPDNWKDEAMQPITNWREEGPDFSCYMLRRDAIKQIGWFDENYYPAYWEDNDFHLRILRAGLHAKRITGAPYYHYGSMTVRINPTLGLGAGRTASVFTNKWGSTPAALMDGHGHKHPYNNLDYSHRYWTGAEKYHGIEQELFGEVISK